MLIRTIVAAHLPNRAIARNSTNSKHHLERETVFRFIGGGDRCAGFVQFLASFYHTLTKIHIKHPYRQSRRECTGHVIGRLAETLLLLIGTILLVSTNLLAETATIHPNFLTTLNSDAKSDTSALAALRDVLQHTGGTASWNGIHSAKLTIQVSPLNITAANQKMVFMDDWTSNVNLKHRRTVTGYSTMHTNVPKKKAEDAGPSNKSFKFDSVVTLLDHLPSAAAAIIVSSNAYIAKMATEASCPKQYRCIGVYHQESRTFRFQKEEEWIVSKSTSLPLLIRIFTAGTEQGMRQQYTEIAFERFRNYDEVMLPSETHIDSPLVGLQRRSLLSVELNAPFDRDNVGMPK